MTIEINKKLTPTTVSFTPQFYKTAVKEYKDNGDCKKLIALMESTENDSHVSGCLEGRRAGFARDWSIVEASESKQDLAIRDFVNEVFQGLQTDDLLEDIFEAKMKVYSVIDLSWDVINNQQVITETSKLNQRYFKFDKKDNNILKLDYGKELRRIDKDSALICNYNRVPVLLPVLRDYILKDFGLENWAGFLEAIRDGFILGKYPPGATKEVINELETAVNSVGSSSRGVAPEGTSIEIIIPNRTAGGQKEFVEMTNTAISISLLGHGNAIQQTGSQIGENSSAYKVKREYALKDILYIERHINSLIKKLVQRNFSAVTLFPVFQIDKSEPINVKERLMIIDSAYEKGYRINPSEFKKLGLMMYEEQEPLEKTFISPMD